MVKKDPKKKDFEKKTKDEKDAMKAIKDELFMETNRNRFRVRYGYMDGVDFSWELGEACGGNKVYASVSDLLENQECAEECGIVRVKITKDKVVWEGSLGCKDAAGDNEVLAHYQNALVRHKKYLKDCEAIIKKLKAEAKAKKLEKK